MKQTEIKPCALCGEGVLHNNQIMFFSIKIKRMVANVGAVQRQAGLEMMLGGNATLANVMGPDDDMAKAIEEQDALVCMSCALNPHPLAELVERIADAKPEGDG